MNLLKPVLQIILIYHCTACNVVICSYQFMLPVCIGNHSRQSRSVQDKHSTKTACAVLVDKTLFPFPRKTLDLSNRSLIRLSLHQLLLKKQKVYLFSRSACFPKRSENWMRCWYRSSFSGMNRDAQNRHKRIPVWTFRSLFLRRNLV